MDEELIIVQSQEDYESATVEDLSLDIEQSETVEYIEVDEPEEISIEIEETVGSPGVGDGNYAPLEHTHPISKVEELSDTLHKLASVKDYHSAHSGFAEFRPWLKNGHYQTEEVYKNTGGVGYFVSLVTATENNIDGNNIYVDICKKKNADSTIEVTDVYGVTVANSGFYGYQDVGYDSLDSTTTNRANDSSYAKVCLLGDVKVRVTSEDHKHIQIGDYVVPNELGYAKKSDNNIGFKVIFKGQIEGVGSTVTAWYYVEIALVPQNDNIARVMKEIENTNVNLEGITIQLGNMSDKITDMEGSNIQLGEEFKGLEDLVNESTNKINTQLPEMEQMLQDAKDIADEASKTINDVALEYAEAVSSAKEAKEVVNDVLTDIDDLKEDMKPLAEWKNQDGTTSGIAGFVAQANKDSTTLASFTEAFGDNGADLTAIIQKIDENGAAIQHLVSHVDKYILGETSPANGLTLDETSIIQPGAIYVPTIDGEESYATEDGSITIEFKYGMSYIWKANDVGIYMWTEYKEVFTFSDVTEFNNIDLKKDDLWYCWQGVLVGDKYLYNPGTLYCWDGQIWVPVASANDGTSSVVSLINQTAKKLTSTYTNLKGDMSLIEQEVDSIRTTVENMDNESLSSIEQTAEEIRMGVYNPKEGSTSLGLLLNGMQNMSNYGGRVCVKHVITETPTISGNRYSQSPMWDGEKFVFAEGALKDDGIYYPYPDDDTKYCKVVNDGYEIYTIGNEATVLLRTEVDENKAAIEGLTKFETDTSETLTALTQKTDANSAEIASVAAGEYVVCTDINLEPTEEDLAQIPSTRYKSAPKWVDGKFVFSEDDVSADGAYYMLEGDDTHYYKLSSNGQSYEQYELASSGSASIIQKVTKNGSSIGLLVGDDGVQGSILVEAINEKSTVLLSANKIGIDGTAVFTDNIGDGTTTISGSYVKTGVIRSNNYDMPITYKKYGLKIQDGHIVKGSNTDYIYYTTLLSGVGYGDLNIEISDYEVVNIGDDTATDDVFVFDEETNTITGLTEQGQQLKELIIPSQIRGYNVLKIDHYAFQGCNSLASITIPNGIISIGNSAFYNCGNLTNITIPDSVASIGREAFINTAYYNDSSNWENEVLYIGKHLVGAKTTISGDYKIKDGTITIAGSAFENCTNLTGVTIPDSVISIGGWAFCYCTNLTNIIISDSITSIGTYAFNETAYYNDENNWDDGVLYISSCLIRANNNIIEYVIKNNTTCVSPYAFDGCTNLTSITIPDSVTSIGDWAFRKCTSLTNITIPSSVTSIGSYAFYRCTGLTSVNIVDIEAWCNITFNDSYSNPLRYAKQLYLNNELVKDLVIPDTVEKISAYTFANYANLTSIIIPNSVTIIGSFAFNNCTALTNITVPNSVEIIGEYTFQNCTNLTSIIIPNGVTNINEGTFYDCTNLASITIPDSVTSIGDWAFWKCINLTNITIPGSVTSIGPDTFYKCTELTITCFYGSYAENYAKSNSIKYTSSVVCYSCNSMEVGQELTLYNHTPGTVTEAMYVVCYGNFKVMLESGNINGMAINLNNGTIYSKNLILDTDGDLSITGKISATSGYIGDKTDGFEILTGNNGYYLGNNQTTLTGTSATRGNKGVYVGANGLGCGNGYFYVDNYGQMSIYTTSIWTMTLTSDSSSTGTELIMQGSDYIAISDFYNSIDGLSSHLARFNCKGNSSATGHIDFYGNLDMNGWTISNQSDSRLKTNIVDTNTNSIDLLNQIDLKSFDWINTGKHVDVGIIAQQLENVLPNMVVTDEQTGLKSITYTELIPYLIKAIQELSAIVSPPIALLSLDEDTHWVDDMTEDEKQYYVELSKPPTAKGSNIK